MTPPSPTSAGGKERRAAARAPAPAPGPGGKARGAVGAGGRLRGRAPGWTHLEPLRRKAAGDVSPAGRKRRGRERGVRVAASPLLILFSQGSKGEFDKIPRPVSELKASTGDISVPSICLVAQIGLSGVHPHSRGLS